MSDNVIDLFDKKTPQQKMLVELVRKNHLLAQALQDENGIPTSPGANILLAILRYLEGNYPPEKHASLQYSLQHRTTDGVPSKNYELVTCYGYREQLTTGQKKVPKLLWQVRVTENELPIGEEPRKLPVLCKNPDNLLVWLQQVCPDNDQSNLAGLGFLQKFIDFTGGVLVHTRATDEFFELNYDHVMHAHYRIKLFAKGLKEDSQV